MHEMTDDAREFSLREDTTSSSSAHLRTSDDIPNDERDGTNHHNLYDHNLINRSWIPPRLLSQQFAPKVSWRKGKWLEEEEVYTKKLIDAFSAGYLNLPSGTTLRSFLSEKLCCDPMRITKKFAGSSCIGKQVFTPCDPKTDPVLITQTEAELKELEEKFRTKIEIQRANEYFPPQTGAMGTQPLPNMASSGANSTFTGPGGTTLRPVLIDLPTELLKNPQAAALFGLNLQSLYAGNAGGLNSKFPHFLSAPDLRNLPYHYFAPSLYFNQGTEGNENGLSLQDVAAELRLPAGQYLPAVLTATAADSATVAAAQSSNSLSALPSGMLLGTDTRSLSKAAAALKQDNHLIFPRAPSMPILHSTSSSSLKFQLPPPAYSLFTPNDRNTSFSALSAAGDNTSSGDKSDTAAEGSSSLSSLSTVLSNNRASQDNQYSNSNSYFQEQQQHQQSQFYSHSRHNSIATSTEEEDIDESNLLINFFKAASKNIAAESVNETEKNAPLSGAKRSRDASEEEHAGIMSKNDNNAVEVGMTLDTSTTSDQEPEEKRPRTNTVTSDNTTVVTSLTTPSPNQQGDALSKSILSTASALVQPVLSHMTLVES